MSVQYESIKTERHRHAGPSTDEVSRAAAAAAAATSGDWVTSRGAATSAGIRGGRGEGTQLMRVTSARWLECQSIAPNSGQFAMRRTGTAATAE